VAEGERGSGTPHANVGRRAGAEARPAPNATEVRCTGESGPAALLPIEVLRNARGGCQAPLKTSRDASGRKATGGREAPLPWAPRSASHRYASWRAERSTRFSGPAEHETSRTGDGWRRGNEGRVPGIRRPLSGPRKADSLPAVPGSRTRDAEKQRRRQGQRQRQRRRQDPTERELHRVLSRGSSWWPNGPRVPPSCAGGPYCQPPALSGPKGPAIPMARAAGRAHWCDPLASSVEMTWVEWRRSPARPTGAPLFVHRWARESRAPLST
jgi:hypothetical protein